MEFNPARKNRKAGGSMNWQRNISIPGYLDNVTGVYQTPRGYYVDDGDVEAFDRGFPPKEKLKLPGQVF